MADRIAGFFRERTPRRVLALAAFIGGLIVFRKLLVLMVFFVAFERLFGVTSAWLSKRMRRKRSTIVLGQVGVLLLLLAGLGFWGADRIARELTTARETFPKKVEAIRSHPVLLQIREQLPDAEKIIGGASHYASDAISLLSTLGHILAYALIGLILAVIYLLEEEALDKWRKSLEAGSLLGTLARWIEYTADAVSVTVQLQMIVALCNTAFTLPVLFVLGIPDKLALMLLIFVSGLVPVIGNAVAGVILSVLAYQSAGWPGVVVFLVLTFVLHKIEAYYLNPRLTSRHVQLPSFVLICSLIAWEYLLGFTGLFVSFPFLFVAGKIRTEMADEDRLAD